MDDDSQLVNWWESKLRLAEEHTAEQQLWLIEEWRKRGWRIFSGNLIFDDIRDQQLGRDGYLALRHPDKGVRTIRVEYKWRSQLKPDLLLEEGSFWTHSEANPCPWEPWTRKKGADILVYSWQRSHPHGPIHHAYWMKPLLEHFWVNIDRWPVKWAYTKRNRHSWWTKNRLVPLAEVAPFLFARTWDPRIDTGETIIDFSTLSEEDHLNGY